MKRCEAITKRFADGVSICDHIAFTRLGNAGHYLCQSHFNAEQGAPGSTEYHWPETVVQPDGEIHPAF